MVRKREPCHSNYSLGFYLISHVNIIIVSQPPFEPEPATEF